VHIFNVTKNITRLLPPDIENSFLVRQEINDCYFFHHEKIRIDKKIKSLIRKRDFDIRSKIRPIHFFSSLHSNEDINNTFSIGRSPYIPKITSYFNSNHTSNNAFSTHISPHIFQPEFQLNQTQDNWLVDLSNTQEVILLLQLGGNFGLPLTFNNHNKMAINFIKHIEKNLAKTPESICESIRNLSIPIINRIFHNDMELKAHNKFLFSLLSITKSFTKQHPEILFTKADKGNTTVILNKDEYINNMTVMLSIPIPIKQSTTILLKNFHKSYAFY